MRQKIAFTFLIACLAGCATRPALVVKTSGERRAPTSPTGLIQTHGIYVCRGLKGIGSAGGLGFWPFESPAAQLSFVEFLRFDESGGVSRWYALEPASVEEARTFFREHARGKWAVTGEYRPVAGAAVEFVLRGLSADGHASSEVPYRGEVYKDYIALTIDHGAIFPPERRYSYREYDFVADKN